LVLNVSVLTVTDWSLWNDYPPQSDLPTKSHSHTRDHANLADWEETQDNVRASDGIEVILLPPERLTFRKRLVNFTTLVGTEGN
jgi:hypothetical protein